MSENPSALVERRTAQWNDAISALPWVAHRLANGDQFNAYDSASNDEDDADEDCDMVIGLGPVSDFGWICEVTGRAQGEMIAAALNLAARQAASHD